VTAGPTSKVDTALAVLAPVPGRAVPLAQVPDPVFAEAMVGPGTAIDPVRTAGVAVARWTGGSRPCTHPRSWSSPAPDAACWSISAWTPSS